MKNELKNPFSITYASHLSDQMISEYWVNFPGGENFLKILNPATSAPKLILGGRGSGKTHLMRHMSFAIQKIKHENNLAFGIIEDGYIGLYFRCGALNAARFEGNNKSEQDWDRIFFYHMELWFAELLLKSFNEAFSGLPYFNRTTQLKICKGIIDLFDEFNGPLPLTISDLSICLQNLRKQINSNVNNMSFTPGVDIKILTSPSSLSLGIPKVIAKYIKEISKLKFLYLIDEFESLSVNQQRYINTIVKECESPTNIFVGARLYGVKTYETLGRREINKPHSDFEPFLLDSFLREETVEYKKFSIELCQKRLSKAGYKLTNIKNALETTTDLERVIKLRSEYNKKKLPPYFDRLKGQLESYQYKGKKLSVKNKELLISKLIVDNDPVMEKANILLLYREWHAGSDLMQASKEINQSCQNYNKGKYKNNPHKKVLEKFRMDFISQLLVRDFDRKSSYHGLDTFIHMSEGLPRNLLILLKKTFDWSVFYGEKPFSTEKNISDRAQFNGVIETAEWFFRETGLLGETGPLVIRSITKLGNFLRELRYSDKPSECSVISFSYDTTNTNQDIIRLIDEAVKFSLLVRISKGQKDRNSKRKDEKLQLSKMLVPYWDLPTASRGTIFFDTHAMEAIFGQDENKFKEFKKARLTEMYVPFRPLNQSGNSRRLNKNKIIQQSEETLFTISYD